MAKHSLHLAVLVSAVLAFGCGGGSNNDFLAINPNPTNSPNPPVLQSKTYDAIGGATLRVNAENGLLNGQQLNGYVFPGGIATTQNGGQITAQADGSFQYTPAPGFRGDDTTTVEGISLTFRVNRRAIFVKNDAPAGGIGSQAAPFNTLADGVNAADQENDILFLFAGDGSSTNQSSPLVLQVDRLELLGEGVGLSTAQGSIVEPGIDPIIEADLSVTANNVTLAGFETRRQSENLAVRPIRFSGVNRGRIHHVHFNAPDGGGLGINDPIGEVVVEDNLFEQSIVHLAASSGTSQVQVRRNQFRTNQPSPGLDATCTLLVGGSADCQVGYTQNSAATVGEGRWNSYLSTRVGDTATLNVTVQSNDNLRGANVAFVSQALDSAAYTQTITNTSADHTGLGVNFLTQGSAQGTLTMANSTIDGARAPQDNLFGNANIFRAEATSNLSVNLTDNFFPGNNLGARGVAFSTDATGEVQLSLVRNAFDSITFFSTRPPQQGASMVVLGYENHIALLNGNNPAAAILIAAMLDIVF